MQDFLYSNYSAVKTPQSTGVFTEFIYEVRSRYHALEGA